MSTTSPDPRYRRRRRRTRTAVGAGLTTVVTVAAIVAAVGFGGGHPTTPAASNLPPATAQVTKATLTETEKVTGTLSYGVPRPVLAKSSEGTVTWLPAAGSIVGLGAPVYKVDGHPIVLIRGSVPPYRLLHSGVKGADVKQLEQSLKALGYTGFTVDDYYGSATENAVREWQQDLGLDQTATVDVDQIVVAPADLRIALLGMDVGASLKADKPVLTYSGTTRVVTIALDVAQQQLVSKGIKATVILPDGKPVEGTVSSLGTVATTNATGSGSSTTTIEVVVTVADQKALGTLDAAPVSVTLTASKRENVLTVPIAALVALASGGYGVQVVQGASTHYAAVKTGMFAGGKVEISGADINEGTTVGVPGS